MEGTADYGKEMRASLDWSDGDLLGQVLKRRIAVSLGASALSEGTVLSDVCVSHYSGDAMQLVTRSTWDIIRLGLTILATHS
jgi:hypothetical protein